MHVMAGLLLIELGQRTAGHVGCQELRCFFVLATFLGPEPLGFFLADCDLNILALGIVETTIALPAALPLSLEGDSMKTCMAVENSAG